MKIHRIRWLIGLDLSGGFPLSRGEMLICMIPGLIVLIWALAAK